MFNLFKNLIPQSVKDAASRVSSTRIQSYYLLGLIYIFATFFLSTELVGMINSGKFEVSDTLEQIFFALLTHHIVFSGVNKNSKSEPSGDNAKNLKEKAEPDEPGLLNG